MRKLLLYLTNIRLTAYVWEKGKLEVGPGFDNNEEGWQSFSDFLGAYPNAPALILIDLIEEDFQRDTIPHVTGNSHKQLVQRRLAQLYRDTPYRHASLQGRDSEGRRDDRVLFSAVINAELPRPWMELLHKQKVPVAGIYSAAILGTFLFKKLRLGSDSLLLVTHQSSGLRQSYFHDGHLRFSRLTKFASGDAQEIAESANTELAKTRQFLASTRQLARDQPIKIVVVAGRDVTERLQQLSPDAPSISHHYFEPEEARATTGLSKPIDSDLCDTLLLTVLATNPPSSHYTLFEHSRFYLLWQARTALYALSAAALTAGLCWTGVNAIDIFEANSQLSLLEADKRALEAKYHALIKSMPPTVAKPHDMKSAVDIEQSVVRNAPAPAKLIEVVSRALDTLPQIRINQLDWQVVDPASVAAAADATAQQAAPPQAVPAEGPQSASLLGLPKEAPQTLLITGEIVPFKQDFRGALESVRQLAAELKKNKQLEVAITLEPLDTRPSVKLQGQAGSDKDDAKAAFAMKLTWKP